MARVLVVEGGERGLSLARTLIHDGYAVRVLTGDPTRRTSVECSGAECWIATPDRLSTMSGALDHVAIACWLLAEVSGSSELVLALHGARLEHFLTRAVDSTLRGFLYEAGGSTVPAKVLAEGERIVSEIGRRNAIPVAILRADPRDAPVWESEARAAVEALLTGVRS